MTLRGFIFVALLVVLVGSIAVRAATAPDPSTESSTSALGALSAKGDAASGAQGFVGSTGSNSGGSSTGSTPVPSGASDGGATAPDSVLPYLTEGSFFGILGFALGYTSRKIVKLFLILLALVFAAVQGLAVAGVADVDWNKALKLANDLIFNVNQHAGWIEFMKAKLPSAGAFCGGFLLGFKRG
ncbi:MAG: FUN14 domain-containing protein [Planctomycetes bacterium]|nr:FUN14 domain-containing protein [Planctomycetota bacterium]